jgi:uncharacterized protein (DUF4415 family)
VSLPRWSALVFRTVGYTFLLAGMNACALSNGEYSSGKIPEWVERGGSSSEFPHARFVTGFAESRERETGMESARQRAAADLTRQVSVRIETAVIDSYREAGGKIQESLTTQIHATTDIRLEGIRFETHRKGRVVWALAVLERLPATAARRTSRDRSLALAEACIQDGEDYEGLGQVGAAAATYRSCRVDLQSAVEDEAVALAVLGGRLSRDDGSHRLASAATRLEGRVRSLPHEVASSIQEAAESLASQLASAGVVRGQSIQIASFVYGDQDVSSPFGREIAMALEAAIGKGEDHSAGPDSKRRPLTLRGMYREEEGEIRIRTIARERESVVLVGSAEVSLAKQAVPKEIEIRPANFSAFLRDVAKLAGGEVVSGDLRVEVLTNKGLSGLVFEEGEKLGLYVRVNQPAWLRLIYVLTNGALVPIEEEWFIDASRVNQLVEYRERFEIIPPFGVEMIHAMAFTERPPPLPTRTTRIEGQRYLVVADGADQVVRDRAMARRKGQQVAEQTLQLTTMTTRGD